MPPPTPEQIALARRFEPVLYLSGSERFLPSDPKRYLERSALWRSRPPGTGPDDWGEEPGTTRPKTPMTEPGGIAGLQSEESSTRTWIGKLLPPTVDEDRFLSLAGWTDSNAPEDGSQNRFADLDSIVAGYRDDPRLAASQPWYCAEILDAAELGRLAAAYPPPGFTANQIGSILSQLQDPTLILYYLFYPGHDEPLDHCERSGEATLFGGFAGDWACVAVVVEQDQPTYLGLTRRNAGSRDPMDERTRLGMVVRRWENAQTLADTHPQVAVASGNHSMFIDVDGPTTREPMSFTTPGLDVGTTSCGDVEKVDGLIPRSSPGGRDTAGDVLIALMKVFCTGGIPIIGEFLAPVAITWLLAEFGESSAYDPFGTDPVIATGDHTPTSTTYGTAIAPKGVLTGAREWPTDDASAPSGVVTVGSRKYPFIVDRQEQLYWASPDNVGYQGRWGPAVAGDPTVAGQACGSRVSGSCSWAGSRECERTQARSPW